MVAIDVAADRRRLAAFVVAVLVALCMIAGTRAAHAAGDVATYLSKITPGEFFPEADRFGAPQGEPAIVPVYRGDQLKGYVYLNSDFANAVGYSGKPIHILVGIDPKGVITGLRLVDHKEPIVLIGIPEPRILAALNGLLGKDMTPIAQGAEHPPQADIVSGATVTVLVMHDSIVRAAMRLIRSARIGGGNAAAVAQPSVIKTIDPDKSAIRDWTSLLGDGSVRRLHLSISDVNEAFAKSGNAAAAQNPEPGNADDTFIDLYVALASVPTIGRSLLGDDGYQRLKERLQPGQQAILVAGDGIYSFKGSAYVRGGIFDRIEVQQDGGSTRFRDKNHTRLGALAAAGAPDLREIGLFVTPPEFTLDPTQPWQLQLLVQRTVGSRDKAFLTFDVDYALPDAYMKRETRAVSPPPKPAAAQSTPAAPEAAIADTEEPLWMRIWRSQTVSVGITALALAVLTGIFFFQNVLVRRPQLYTWVRRAYLLFVLVWLGWYANAQLSVVNVFTFANALLTGFHWEFFLAAPLIFILWGATAAGLLFWGRGPFCGWLCPFGALQELTNTVAKWLKVPQITVPWGLHERLWPIKYIVFLGLFGLSLYSVALAEQFAEVEPFKTAIILKFARGWPFVLYAAALLGIGLFIERFFCRYLCPLGAALAIPGRIRTFEWLRRWKECGSPCQRCAKECPVQSIHPEGHINVNECIYCMHCQELYYDDQRCPHMIQVRLKREKFEAMSSPSMRAGKAGPKTVITHAGQPMTAPAQPSDLTSPS
ncbi:nitrous oxide reductase regulatory protein NosR [Bradyrhizobium oligotrophicum S58]|uniref:Nitrous oxide reductase regulatory protein NosR n=1 Tax=Bradyrhizobium oligotrophicum S58 TaxID=1245469 RepID=M4ZF59_9BRAD|nr:NosR/NirI family protein [Bradyrhizobium oligotrophicum]BAM92458.1 nitrous oxide reductase regulatory protein NosR [Bradyrhizobium oligotrophicum S58]